MTNQALAGVRILDFTRVLAGPTCTMLLADLGADVIKVEQPGHGDDTRAWGPPYAGAASDGMSAYYLSVNRNKRSLTLNLKSAEGQQIARQLAVNSQIVIENFKVGQMAALGLGYNDLRQLNPALVYCSITGFGQDGPYAQRPGYDYVVQAMSGLMSITGAVTGEPQKVGVAISDVTTGLFAASALLAALRHAEHTGEGQYIDMALLDAQVAALVNVASNVLVGGRDAMRWGNQHPNIVPYQTFEASDGDFVLACGNDRQFRALCQIIEQPEWSEDARFATNPARVAHRDVLVSQLTAIFVMHPAAHWVDLLLAAGIPAGPLNSVQDALYDPHVQARGMVQQVRLPNGAEVPLVASPLKLSATPPQTRTPPPLVGQDTDAILRDVLGLDAATVADYRAQGVV